MYELNIPPNKRERFKEVVRKKMSEQECTVKDLAKAIKRPQSSVYGFFNKDKANRFIAAEIAMALNIKNYEWR